MSVALPCKAVFKYVDFSWYIQQLIRGGTQTEGVWTEER
jgi:hypothetical protein